MKLSESQLRGKIYRMVLREMTQLGNDDEERRAYELWDQYQDDCDWDAYDHHDHQDECNVSMEVEGFKFEGYGFMDPYGAYKEVESMDCTLPSGRVINVYPGNHPGIAPEANNETNDNTMANRVTMNEAQLRNKVYKMVCESFEALMAEGKTFKDQKAWGNKGFQKQNKFQKTDKYKNWKNGGNMNSDTDECMKEGEDKGYKVIEKGDGMFPKRIQLSGEDGREGWEKLCKSKQFVKPNSDTDECMNEGVDEIDWKTAQWAADERARRNAEVSGDQGYNSPYYSKYQKMGGGDVKNGIAKGNALQRSSSDAAKQKFNDEFGYDDGNGAKVGYSRYTWDNADGTATGGGVGVTDGNQRFSSALMAPTSSHGNADTPIYNKGNGTFYSANSVNQSLAGNQPLQNAFSKADQEMRNYRTGNYTYDKGQGWHLEEAALKKVVSEAVKNALKKLQ